MCDDVSVGRLDYIHRRSLIANHSSIHHFSNTSLDLSERRDYVYYIISLITSFNQQFRYKVHSAFNSAYI